MWSVMGIVLMAGSMTMATLVDNFDGYTAGQIDAVTGGTWVSTSNNATPAPVSTMVIATDPTNSGNQVLSARPTGGQSGLYGVLSGDEVIADNITKTMSLKFMVTTDTYDSSFGLTTLDAPYQFGNTFNAQCALINGTFRVRNGGSTSGSLAAITANTWYYLWAVVDNTANTYDVYLKTTASDATAGDLIANDFAFRTGCPDGDIDRFFVMMQNTSVDVLFDDINMREGVELTYIPEPASMLILGLGGLVLSLRKR